MRNWLLCTSADVIWHSVVCCAICPEERKSLLQKVGTFLGCISTCNTRNYCVSLCLAVCWISLLTVTLRLVDAQSVIQAIQHSCVCSNSSLCYIAVLCRCCHCVISSSTCFPPFCWFTDCSVMTIIITQSQSNLAKAALNALHTLHALDSITIAVTKIYRGSQKLKVSHMTRTQICI